MGDLIEEDLVRYIRARFADVSAHLAHDTNMFIAVEERVFLFFRALLSTVSSSISFEASVREDHNEPLCALVCGWYGNMLLGDQAWKYWWR